MMRLPGYKRSTVPERATAWFAAILGTGCGRDCLPGTPLAGRNLVAGEWGHNPLPWMTAGNIPDLAAGAGKPAASSGGFRARASRTTMCGHGLDPAGKIPAG